MTHYRARFTLALGLVLAAAGLTLPASAQITVLNSFNPAEVSSLCSVAAGQTAETVWVYGCGGDQIYGYAPDGTFLTSIARPGESANDVDLDVAPEAFIMGDTAVPAGSLLFINGETDVAEIYALDTVTGDVLATLVTEFGISHVVGGAYHPLRDTFFLVQDNVPGTDDENRVAEIDPATGSVLSTFQTTATFSVYYGDIDVSTVSGNLFLVSSSEDGIGEFTPEGNFVQVHAIPEEVASISGVGLRCDVGEAWVAGTGGVVWRLGNVPCSGAAALIGASLSCSPATGTVPFTTQMTVALDNLYDQQVRRVAARIDISLASGSQFPNWRAGSTNIAAGGSYDAMFPVTIPALGSVIGDNQFELAAEDVTPSPFNQPPYPPSGDTAIDSCTVTAVAS